MKRAPMRGVLLAALLALFVPGAALSQGTGDAVPRLPGGVSVVLLPVQSAVPLPSGAWPAGASSREALLEQVNAELQFAFDERGESGDDWHTPAEVVDLAARNPTLDVEPRRLAGSLLQATSKGDRVPAPLHGQLRRVSALFDARYMLVPLTLGWEPDTTTAAAGRDTAPAPDSAAGPAAPEGRTTGRAVLDLAMVDIRRGVVLWRGELHSDPASRDSPALLATLAARLARGAVP